MFSVHFNTLMSSAFMKVNESKAKVLYSVRKRLKPDRSKTQRNREILAWPSCKVQSKKYRRLRCQQLQLSNSAETTHTGTASNLKLRSEYTKMNPRPSPKHGKMPIRVTALAFDLCLPYYPTAHVPYYSSLSIKNSGKEADSQSNYHIFIQGPLSVIFLSVILS